MTQPIEAALTAIAGVVGAVSGISQAPVNPMEQANLFPFAITYYVTGNQEAAPVGTKKNMFNVAVEVLKKRDRLDMDLVVLLPYLDLIPAALIGQVTPSGSLFSNTITTFERVNVLFLPNYDYAGVQMIGYRFIMENVKILVNT